MTRQIPEVVLGKVFIEYGGEREVAQVRLQLMMHFGLVELQMEIIVTLRKILAVRLLKQLVERTHGKGLLWWVHGQYQKKTL